jgi:uncharacterized membrane protein
MQLFIGLAATFVGFILGLGAVTVIDLHGFLGRASTYWTDATTRTHKVTKPLIWAGTLLYALGLITLAMAPGFTVEHLTLRMIILLLLITNGCFLSFAVSPYLLRREAAGNGSALLPAPWQRAITISFIISFLGWWSSVAFVLVDLVHQLR